MFTKNLEFIRLSEKRLNDSKKNLWLKNILSVCVGRVEAHNSMLAGAEKEPAAVWKAASLFPWELKGGFPSLSWVLWESDTDQLGG